jgi:hypothetical protein
MIGMWDWYVRMYVCMYVCMYVSDSMLLLGACQ